VLTQLGPVCRKKIDCSGLWVVGDANDLAVARERVSKVMVGGIRCARFSKLSLVLACWWRRRKLGPRGKSGLAIAGNFPTPSPQAHVVAHSKDGKKLWRGDMCE